MINSLLCRNRVALDAARLCSLTVAVCALVMIQSLFAVNASAQATTPPPPPIGPASYRSDQKQLGVGVITSLVRGKTEEIVKNANDQIRASGQGNITVEFMSLRVNRPMRIPTEYTNRFNQWYVKIPMNIGLKIRIPAASDRRVYIPLDINLSCEEWFSPNGSLRVIAQPGPISVEGGNIIEEIIRVRDYIDNQVKSNFPRLPLINATPGTFPCSTIGTSPGEPPDYRFGFVAWDPPIRRRPIDDARISPSVEVTFLKLKRLRARDRSGAILYQPTENIMLETYVNFLARQSPTLTMQEGQEVNLNFPPMVLKTSGVDALVIVANINQPNAQPQDSAFNAWPRSANFSPGTHTMTITKLYTVPPTPPIRKPTFIRVPAYELTYSVRNVGGVIGGGGVITQ